MVRVGLKSILRIILVGIILPCIVQVAGQDPAPPSGPTVSEFDERKFERYKKEVCDAVPQFAVGEGASSSGGSKWSDKLTETEVLELAMVNMAYGLTADSVTHIKVELGWMKTVLDLISIITKASCTDTILADTHINSARNLFMYYLVKRGHGQENVTAKRTEEWKEIINVISDCANTITPIEVTTDCGYASTYMAKDGRIYDVPIVEEQMDQDGGIDHVIDTVWWMFSATHARCYAYAYPNVDPIMDFFELFKEDFLKPFNDRWRGAGEYETGFSIILGPAPFDVATANTRRCAAISYHYEGLEKRQLVRPLPVKVNRKWVKNYRIE